MSLKKVTTTKITAKQASRHGMPSIFRNGQVHEVTYHTGRTIAVCKFVDATNGTAIVKDGRGKRRTIPFSSIRTMMVHTNLVKGLPT